MKKNNFKIGDKIKIINATCGAFGADNCIGIVTKKESTNGLGDWQKGFNVEIIKSDAPSKIGSIWRVGINGEYELIKHKRSVKEIIIMEKGNETISVIEDKVGRARRNPEDNYDESMGILVATMRALKIDEKRVDDIVEIMLGKTFKEIGDFSTKELYEELGKRIG